MVIGQAYCCVCTKNAAIDRFYSYIGTTYSRVLKNTTIGFFFPPSITTSCYTSSQHHNSLLSQLPVTSQHHKFPTTNLEQQVPNTKLPKDIYIYIYIYKFCTSQKIYRNDFFTFKTAFKQPQTVSSNITNCTFYVKKNIYTNVCVYNMHRMSSVSFASILNGNAFLSTSW